MEKINNISNFFYKIPGRAWNITKKSHCTIKLKELIESPDIQATICGAALETACPYSTLWMSFFYHNFLACSPEKKTQMEKAYTQGFFFGGGSALLYRTLPLPIQLLVVTPIACVFGREVNKEGVSVQIALQKTFKSTALFVQDLVRGKTEKYVIPAKEKISTFCSTLRNRGKLGKMASQAGQCLLSGLRAGVSKVCRHRSITEVSVYRASPFPSDFQNQKSSIAAQYSYRKIEQEGHGQPRVVQHSAYRMTQEGNQQPKMMGRSFYEIYEAGNPEPERREEVFHSGMSEDELAKLPFFSE